MIFSNECYLCNRCNKFNRGDCTQGDDIFCQKLFRVDSLYSNSLLSNIQRKPGEFILLQNEYDLEAFKFLTEFEKNIIDNIQQGKNLYIYSQTTGNGKTAWAIRLLQSYILNSWYSVSCDKCLALFINIPRFLLELKSNISQHSDYVEHIQKNVLNCDLVIWDDVATKGTTEFETEHLLSMINSRIDNGKSNIYTSNIIPQHLNEFIGSRLTSRLMMSQLIEFKDPDKRFIVAERR